MTEKTLAMIKPDAIKHVLDIVELLHGDLLIQKMERLTLTREQAEEFYQEHAGRWYFERLIAFTISGRVCAMVLAGPNAVKAWRAMIGPTDPKDAPKTTLRGKYGTEQPCNAVHGSDSIESARREIAFFKKLLAPKWDEVELP